MRYKSPFAVAIIDLDHFKTINDNYGHTVGDKVLKEFSRILKNQLRTTDILGRWGGEEFIVVANNTSENGMFVLIERLVALIQTHDFEDIQELTFSAGVTSFKNEKTYSEIVERLIMDYIWLKAWAEIKFNYIHRIRLKMCNEI